MKKIIFASMLSMFAFTATNAQVQSTTTTTTTTDGQTDPNDAMKNELAQKIAALRADENMLTKQINELQRMRPAPAEKIKALKNQLQNDMQQEAMLQKKLDGLNGAHGASTSKPYKDTKNSTKTNHEGTNPGHTTHKINTNPSNTNNTKNVNAAPNPGSTTHKISTETPPVHPPVQDPKSVTH